MESVWNNVKAVLEERLPGHSFRMWIEPVKFENRSGDDFRVSCPNLFSKKRVQDHYGSMIQDEVRTLLGSDISLCLDVRKGTNGASRGPVVKKGLKKVETQLVIPNVANPVMHSGRMLRPDFTLDDFVVSGNNDFAYSAALSLASSTQTQNSSLFLLSDTGMGKSHLTQAIGHHINRKKPGERVYYITAEDFTNEMIGSFKNDTAGQFKDKYRSQCDVLLLEDVHFLGGKERTQIELAMTLDYLMESGKKIMFSSCYLPNDIPKMNEQLASRFTSGLISPIEDPNFRTRVRILKKKAASKGHQLPMDIIEYLAGELTDNIRQLESGLVSVTAKSSLMGVPLDLDLAESVVKNIATKKKRVTIDVIKKLVCREFNITPTDIVSKSRKKTIVKPRQVAIYLSRRYTDQPLQAIGKNFNRYHATVMHAVGTIEKDIRQEVQMRNQIEYLSRKIENGDF
ncbi:chromosomal replication initiator protein DnaA [Desulfoluna spongiiphila]|uniref:Chromosomal replication initiator protein DnaA n=1 Tax=Desulfoluna spongiiphila TaxID=419481 RepID=A0A1G5AH38_9BACT|nr:chromosomal replication initiator protein DnaA [Desulfoluna spongiiphila]SCX77224.1 chromosomal replication initiator protein [Desulfoluna spongiiphila]VVS90589.1 trp repressor/replication initiator [Desulfoluna spongiiphila]